MSSPQVIENSIEIRASATAVERCIVEPELMHRWLNPALKCEAIGEWSGELGSRSRFILKIPLLEPSLYSVIVEREPGLVVWQFKGFFRGLDTWECLPNSRGTRLRNRFEFEIPNPIISWGFKTFAANWTREDMQAQLRRLKRVAEEVYHS